MHYACDMPLAKTGRGRARGVLMNFSVDDDRRICICRRWHCVCSRKLVEIKVHGHGVPVPVNTVKKNRKTSGCVEWVCVCVCVCVFWSLYLVKLINLCSNPDLVKLISIPMKTDCWCWLDTSMAWCATQGCCTLCSTIRSCCIIVSYIFLFSLYDPRCVVCVGVECSDVMELYMDRWGNRHLPMKPV